MHRPIARGEGVLESWSSRAALRSSTGEKVTKEERVSASGGGFPAGKIWPSSPGSRLACEQSMN